MTNSKHSLAATAVAVALSLTVTDAATAQAAPAAPAETRYVLVDVGGKALPVEVEKEWRCREDVTAGTLRLREDGLWRLETLVRETCGDRTETEPRTRTAGIAPRGRHSISWTTTAIGTGQIGACEMRSTWTSSTGAPSPTAAR